MRQVFLDTETTGLSPDQGDRIIEIGCVEMVNRKLTGNNKHFYVNPGRDSHEEALRVHGITTEFLGDKPKFEAVVDELLSYLKDANIVIHNAPFDLGFLNREMQLLGRPVFRQFVASVTDSLALAKELYPGKRNGLDALCDRLGVDNSARTLHGALLDAELLADVYINLTRGQDALLVDTPATSEAGNHQVKVDLRTFDLAIVPASESEDVAHEEVLKQIDKSSHGKTVWRMAA